MRSLYFLAQSKNLERFTALFDRENILATSFNTADIASLTAFIMRDKAIAQQDFVVLDVGKVDVWSDTHILSAVQHLRRFSSAKLIFMGEPCEAVTELFGVLAGVHHVEHLITLRPETDAEAALQDCFSQKNQFHDKLQAIQEMMTQQAIKVARPLNIPHGFTLQVAVAGTMPRSGTTMSAFSVYHYLHSLGFRPALIDKSGATLPLLMQYEEYERGEEDVVTIHGVHFTTQKSAQFDAYITDYGTLTAQTAPLFCNADLNMLIGCTKPWELPAFAEALRNLSPYSCRNLITLANHASPQELATLSKYFGANCNVAPYSPDLWEASATAAGYDDFLLPSLKQLCGMPYAAEQEAECDRL